MSDDQVRTLESLLHEFEYPVAKHAARMKMITDYFSVDSIQNLPARCFDEAKARLVEWLKKWQEASRK